MHFILRTLSTESGQGSGPGSAKPGDLPVKPGEGDTVALHPPRHDPYGQLIWVEDKVCTSHGPIKSL